MLTFRFVILAILSLQAVLSGRDFYKILGIPRNANKEQIKNAYRTMAKTHHPDANKNDPDAQKKFQEVNNAYEVLKDDKKRKTYDKHGEEGLRGNGGGGDPFGGFGSMFGSFFNFGGDSQGSGEKEQARGGDVVMNLFVSLNELYNGEIVKIKRIKANKEKAKGTRKCNCRVEVKTVQVGHGQFQIIKEQVCDECPNFKYVQKEIELEVDIMPGMPEEHVVSIDGEGEPHTDGENGDLLLVLKTIRHSVFKRVKDDLFTNMTISLVDALVGFIHEIPHLDNHMVKIEKKDVTYPGQVWKITNQGMPRYRTTGSYYGDLYITFSIEMPPHVDPKWKDDVKKILGQTSKPKVASDKVRKGRIGAKKGGKEFKACVEKIYTGHKYYFDYV